MQKYKVKITLIEQMLGTAPANKEIYSEFVLKKAPVIEVEEIETLEVGDPSAVTIFHKVDGNPVLYDYMIKGFVKEACSMMRKVTDSATSKLSAYKKNIDGLLFVYPRLIPVELSGPISTISRPLRASTPQGERISLTKSETIPAGSSMEFEILILGVITENMLIELLNYGQYKGLGCWRNASWGRFTYQIAKA